MKGLTLNIDTDMYKDMHSYKIRHDITTMQDFIGRALSFCKDQNDNDKLCAEDFSVHLSDIRNRFYQRDIRSVTVYMTMQGYRKLKALHTILSSVYLKDTLTVIIYLFLMHHLPIVKHAESSNKNRQNEI